MPTEKIICHNCGSTAAERYLNPIPTVDAIIINHDKREYPDFPEPPKVVLIRRKNPPYGWALPGGFVDQGETLKDAAIREASEETGIRKSYLQICRSGLVGIYDAPDRDPRGHYISTVFYFHTSFKESEFKAGDDATEIKFVDLYNIQFKKYTKDIVLDHCKMLLDYWINNN